MIRIVTPLLLLLFQCQAFSHHTIKKKTPTIATTTTIKRRRQLFERRSRITFRSTQISSSSSSQQQQEDEELSNEEIERYSRHLVLGDVGMKGQKRLKNSRVLVIGAGGLGSPCLMYLAAAGVGHIGIVDADTVDESNLQRQIIHSTSTISQPKTTSAKHRLHQLNPHISIHLYTQEFTSTTALSILDSHPWDVIIDGSDNFPTKYLINDACRIKRLPWIYSAILGFEGQLSVFNLHVNTSPDYRDMLPIPPPPGDVPSCAEGGVLGVLPGTMGCLQATEAIKILLNEGKVLDGRVLVFDAMTMTFREVGLERLEEGERVVVEELIDYEGFCKSGGTDAVPQEQQQLKQETVSNGRTMDEVETINNNNHHIPPPAFHSIPPKSCLQKLSSGWIPYVLDVRLSTEHDIVSLPFTDGIKPHRTVSTLDIPKEGDVLIYCKGGVRGVKACEKLVREGVEGERLYNLEGGIMRWRKDVDSTMPKY